VREATHNTPLTADLERRRVCSSPPGGALLVSRIRAADRLSSCGGPGLGARLHGATRAQCALCTVLRAVQCALRSSVRRTVRYGALYAGHRTQCYGLGVARPPGANLVLSTVHSTQYISEYCGVHHSWYTVTGHCNVQCTVYIVHSPCQWLLWRWGSPSRGTCAGNIQIQWAV
jgi:hypothetical protein